MSADQIVARFADLFAGRTDAFGTEDGGCLRCTGGPAYAEHLLGTIPIGIYPVVGQREESGDWFVVKWGACDIDYEDLQEAVNFHDLLAQVGIPSYIERSRSKGYHVWVFVERWISAETMRHALLVVRDFLKMQAREIYPKQVALREGELGNYLRLPYPGALNDIGKCHGFTVDGRRVMLNENRWPMGLEAFLNAQEYADPADLEKLASRYVPPVQQEVRWQREATNDDNFHDHQAYATLLRVNSALAWHIYNRGALEGRDRSSTLMRLCNMVMEKGATPEEAFSIIWSADCKEHSRKYVDRSDGEEQIVALVNRVYSNKLKGRIDSA